MSIQPNLSQFRGTFNFSYLAKIFQTAKSNMDRQNMPNSIRTKRFWQFAIILAHVLNDWFKALPSRFRIDNIPPADNFTKKVQFLVRLMNKKHGPQIKNLFIAASDYGTIAPSMVLLVQMTEQLFLPPNLWSPLPDWSIIGGWLILNCHFVTWTLVRQNSQLFPEIIHYSAYFISQYGERFLSVNQGDAKLQEIYASLAPAHLDCLSDPTVRNMIPVFEKYNFGDLVPDAPAISHQEMSKTLQDTIIKECYFIEEDSSDEAEPEKITKIFRRTPIMPITNAPIRRQWRFSAAINKVLCIIATFIVLIVISSIISHCSHHYT